MGFILSIIAYLLFLPVALLNFIVVMYKSVREFGFWKSMNRYWFNNALEIDIWANYHFRTLWNTLLRKKNGYRFGKKGETISSALGKNQITRTYSIPGWILIMALYVIDVRYWGKGGHCINSITE